jgi:hypothetical protein
MTIQHSPCQQAFYAVGALPQGSIGARIGQSVILMGFCQQTGHCDPQIKTRQFSLILA